MRIQHFSALLLTGLAAASPLGARQAATTTATVDQAGSTGSTGSGSSVDMVAAILAIMPLSKSCADAKGSDECRTAEQAAPFFTNSTTGFSDGERAAMLALMGFESEQFRFKYNLVNEGQGTANMMMPNFISEYATDVVGPEQVASKGNSLVGVLDLVTVDEHNFGSAGWYLTTKCDAGVREALKTGTDASWLAYMACVGVNGSEQRRMDFWNRAKAAFNL